MTWIAAAAAAVLSVTPLGFPDGLEHLEKNAGDPAQFVDDIRAYHNVELAAIELLKSEYARLRGPESAARREEIQKDVQVRLGRVRAVYEAALNKYSTDCRLRSYYGELLYDNLAEYAGALKEWNLALTYDEKCHRAMNNLALHYVHSGRYDIGLEYMDEALDLDRKNPDYLYNIAQIYLVHFPQVAQLKGWKKTKVYKKAMKYSEDALKYQPDDYDLASDYAMNFYTAENFGIEPDWDDARDAWEAARALASTPEEEFFCWVNQGRVLLRDDVYDEAAVCFRKALDIKGDSEIVQELLRQTEALMQDLAGRG